MNAFKSTHTTRGGTEVIVVATNPVLLEQSIVVYESGEVSVSQTESLTPIDLFKGREVGDPVWVRDSGGEPWLLRSFHSSGGKIYPIYVFSAVDPITKNSKAYGYSQFTFTKP